MNEAQLDAFLAIVRDGGFNKAAERLYLSQPTVTRRIHQLEEELGATLLLRGAATGTQLTVAGLTLLPLAERICALYDQVRTEISPYKGQSEIVVGCADPMLDGESSAFFLIVQELVPRLHVTLKTKRLGKGSEQKEQLLTGGVDFLFSDLSAAAWNDSRLARAKLFDGGVYAYVHRLSPMSAWERLPLAALNGQTLYWYQDNTFLREVVGRQLRRQKISWREEECDSMAEALSQLTPQQGALLTVVRKNTVSQLACLSVSRDVCIPAGVLWVKDRCAPVVRQLIHEICDLPSSIWRR